MGPTDLDEVRWAIRQSPVGGVKLCLTLPSAWQGIAPRRRGTCRRRPGGVSLVHTWLLPNQKLTWAALAMYCDEMYTIIDSVNAWKRKRPNAYDYPALVKAVNKVSSTRITA